MVSESTWHEEDDFWEAFAPFMFGEQMWQATPGEVDQVLALLNLEPEAALLDIGCGPGRHSLELARRGFHVTGVDRTVAFLERAGRKAASESLDVDFVLEDMRRFCRDCSFDAALSLFASFGYFEKQDDNLQVLRNVHSSLKPGGRLILDVIGKEVLARIFQARDWMEKDGKFYLQERRVCKNWSWMENRWILLDGNRRAEYEVSHWIYSAVELTELLLSSGFVTVDVFGDLSGSPYDQSAGRLLMVAQR
jgi:SAM-dependent methyltransferase